MSYVDHNPCCLFIYSTITLGVLVSLGFYDKIQLNKWFKQQRVISNYAEAIKFNVKMFEDSVSHERLFLGLHTLLAVSSHSTKKDTSVPIKRDTNSVIEA